MSAGILMYEFSLFWGGIVWFRKVRLTQHPELCCNMLRGGAFHTQTMSLLTNVVSYILE